jgi:hypothetical protein
MVTRSVINLLRGREGNEKRTKSEINASAR